MADRVYDGVFLDEVDVVLDISSQPEDVPARNQERKVLYHIVLLKGFAGVIDCCFNTDNDTNTCISLIPGEKSRHRHDCSASPPPYAQAVSRSCVPSAAFDSATTIKPDRLPLVT